MTAPAAPTLVPPTPKEFWEKEGVHLNRVYARNDGKTFRTIGWLGKNSVIVSEVHIKVFQYTPFGPSYTVRKIKGVSEFMKTYTMDKFAEIFGPVSEKHVVE